MSPFKIRAMFVGGLAATMALAAPALAFAPPVPVHLPTVTTALHPYTCPDKGTNQDPTLPSAGEGYGTVANAGVWTADHSAPQYGVLYYGAGACASAAGKTVDPRVYAGQGPFTKGVSVNPGDSSGSYTYSVVYYPGDGTVCFGTSGGIYWCTCSAGICAE